MFHKFLSVATLLTLLLAPVSSAVAKTWLTDFSSAQKKAVEEDRDILLYFGGGEWCLQCIIWKKTVFSTDEFAASVATEFVLVDLDFPAPTRDAEVSQDPQMQQNRKLEKEYKTNPGFPFIVLVDPEGRPYASTIYFPGGIETFLPRIEELHAKRQTRDRALAEAAASQGVAKAKALDAALNVVGIEFALSHYTDEIQSIIALDPDNAARLYEKYAPAYEASRINTDFVAALDLIDRGEYEVGVARLEQIVTDYELQGERRQHYKVVAGQVLMHAKRPAEAVERFRDALAAAPDSDVASQIEQLITLAQAQAADD